MPENLSAEDLDYLRAKSQSPDYLSVYLPMVEANIPRYYRDFEYAQLTASWVQPAVQTIKDYVDAVALKGIYAVKGKGFYITGGHKSGKTACACVLLKNIIRLAKAGKRYECFFIPFEVMLDRLRDGLNSFTESDVDFLVIDNFGETIPLEYMENRVITLIRNRFYQAKPTIITASRDNIKREALKSVFTDSVHRLVLGTAAYNDK